VRILTLDQIRECIDDDAIIDCMRDALIAQSRGECETPMPMHLNIGAEASRQAETPAPPRGEVHMKSSYRRGGNYFALKMATTFGGVGNGMIMLASAETGEPVALLQDAGHLTDVRTAAVSAMVARELGRTDRAIGILGSGIQARLTARFHARVLPLEQVWLWGRNAEHVEDCAVELRRSVHDVQIAKSPAEVAAETKLIVTCTAAREPLLFARDLQPGFHISAVGADSVGKQELDPEILRGADVLLADSVMQCQRLGELQHAPDLMRRAVEIGAFLDARSLTVAPHFSGVAQLSVADFTGLGVEDLYIAEMIFAVTFSPGLSPTLTGGV
jgi:ornithine cyclodeaminase